MGMFTAAVARALAGRRHEFRCVALYAFPDGRGSANDRHLLTGDFGEWGVPLSTRRSQLCDGSKAPAGRPMWSAGSKPRWSAMRS